MKRWALYSSSRASYKGWQFKMNSLKCKVYIVNTKLQIRMVGGCKVFKVTDCKMKRHKDFYSGFGFFIWLKFTRKRDTECGGLVASSWKWVSASRHDAPNWISTWHLHFHPGRDDDDDDDDVEDDDDKSLKNHDFCHPLQWEARQWFSVNHH